MISFGFRPSVLISFTGGRFFFERKGLRSQRFPHSMVLEGKGMKVGQDASTVLERGIRLRVSLLNLVQTYLRLSIIETIC